MINFKPLRGLVLIKRETPESEVGGIFIPEAVRTYSWRASVVNVGYEVKNIKAGDQILFIKDFTVLPFIKERDMAITNADNIAARIEVEGEIERIIPANAYVMLDPYIEADKDGIELVRKWEGKTAHIGTILKCGDDCDVADTFIGQKAWYPPSAAIKCVEDDKHYVIVNEEEILCVEGT